MRYRFCCTAMTTFWSFIKRQNWIDIVPFCNWVFHGLLSWTVQIRELLTSTDLSYFLAILHTSSNLRLMSIICFNLPRISTGKLYK